MKFLVLTFTLLFAFYVNAAVFVTPDRQVKAYSASIKPFSTAATPTDLCFITGSATKVVRVNSVEISTNQTTAGTNEIQLIKRTTANAFATGVAMSTVAWDSGSPAATAIVSSYSSNPSTLGVSSGILLLKRVMTGTSTSLLNPVVSFFSPNDHVWRPVILRGTGESLVVGMAGVVSSAGFTINCSFEFDEE